MTSSTDVEQLTERDRRILKEVILTHILSAEPVSSRTVAKHGSLGLSAASIRNVMADLEDLGFLSQPHTSAGRVPTSKAYHLYIESMMSARGVSEEDRQVIRDELDGSGRSAENLTVAVSHLLSQLTSQVGIVTTPAIADTCLRSLDFVALSERKVLCVVVSESGFVDHKVIRTKEQVPRHELVRISNYLNDNFAGKSLREIREALLRLMAEERARVDRVLALAIRLAEEGLDLAQSQDVVFDGTPGVLSQPELSDIERVRRLFETFSDKARLVYMITECMKGPGVRVLIGEDSALTSELGFSLVATSYGVGDRSLGTVGVFGPSRMEYQRTIPLVNYLGEKLSEALTETFSSSFPRLER